MEELLEAADSGDDGYSEIREELEEVERLIEEVLIYRSCQKERSSTTRIDKIAEEEISPDNCRKWQMSTEVVSNMIISNYNLTVRKLKAIPEENLPERREVDRALENGSVNMNESHGPYIGGVSPGPRVPGPELSPERDLTGLYENLKENTAIIGYNLEAVARGSSDLVDIEDLRSYPKEWMH